MIVQASSSSPFGPLLLLLLLLGRPVVVGRVGPAASASHEGSRRGAVWVMAGALARVAGNIDIAV